MKAIFTKYIPATNTRGSRIKAYDGDNSIILPYDGSLSTEQVHRKAAIALCNKLGWKGALCEGSSKSGNVYVFIEDWTIFKI